MIQSIDHVIDFDADAQPMPCPRESGTWEVFQHTRMGQFEFDPQKIRMYRSPIMEDQEWVRVPQLHKEVKNKDPLNANFVDYLLAHPDAIPDEWKVFVEIACFGTIYRCFVEKGEGVVDPYSTYWVRCLYWNKFTSEWISWSSMIAPFNIQTNCTVAACLLP